ncbi:biotin--[acetyl-CoA-carboxylase] ligase [Sporolactobacillus spathodeae]|uniref:Bifunctional ligase/repressor BirA n=1 Tax=Sporolactobacillus spathodeae TaxID=1465502 RepID=A0ABS2Q883_9BACL|nr:biotin--[acetyl-CoA-carboxylase] ligase [Sporolactobacillus spathodeae]MBM7657998.1 BirA family biotin operon repressor/biotin-[acetyl-CoA-carboxylase] ligase [Sporolactobacillus spathodeae]
MVQRVAKGTKNAILRLLYENRSHYLSGEKISQLLDCSRTAVWKHIRELTAEGYIIEALQKSGYRLISAPDGVNEAAILTGLETKQLGHTIIFSERMDSTQKKALELADDGAEEGTLVVTNEQVAGRGRLGHHWQSTRGTNISMSLILRPRLPIEKTPQLTLLTAVAVADAIEEVSGLYCRIKWPNDILYENAKLVGILTELQAESSFVKAVIIGIGINGNTSPESFSGELAGKASSLRAITGDHYDLSHLIQVFLKRFETLYDRYLDKGFLAIKPLWVRRAASLGKKIKVRQPGGHVLSGKAIGINDDGVLLLEKEQGEITRVYSADIEWN